MHLTGTVNRERPHLNMGPGRWLVGKEIARIDVAADSAETVSTVA